jgi:predicted CopG family antitoxin
MEAEHFSKEWDDAPMPNSIFFTGEGHAIHGSFHVNSLGRKASHGCVRLAPENAAILFGLVQEAGLGNSRVTIKGGFFDFGYSPKRSFSDVGNDIDKTIAKKRKTSGFASLFGTPKPKKIAKKSVKKVAKAAAKKPDDKAKKLAAKKPDEKAKKIVVAKKLDEAPKKAVDAKCTTKDGKKLCPKIAPVKAASNG